MPKYTNGADLLYCHVPRSDRNLAQKMEVVCIQKSLLALN
jgi:hypothetical protein